MTKSARLKEPTNCDRAAICTVGLEAVGIGFVELKSAVDHLSFALGFTGIRDSNPGRQIREHNEALNVVLEEIGLVGLLDPAKGARVGWQELSREIAHKHQNMLYYDNDAERYVLSKHGMLLLAFAEDCNILYGAGLDETGRLGHLAALILDHRHEQGKRLEFISERGRYSLDNPSANPKITIVVGLESLQATLNEFFNRSDFIIRETEGRVKGLDSIISALVKNIKQVRCLENPDRFVSGLQGDIVRGNGGEVADIENLVPKDKAEREKLRRIAIEEMSGKFQKLRRYYSDKELAKELRYPLDTFIRLQEGRPLGYTEVEPAIVKELQRLGY